MADDKKKPDETKQTPPAENKTNEDIDTKFVKEEGVVKIPRLEWEQIQKDVANLKKGVSDEGVKAPVAQEHKVKVRFYEGKPVVDIGKVFKEKDEKGEEKEYIPIWVEGSEKPINVLYGDFYFKFDRQDVKVKKRIQEEVREHQYELYTTRKEVQGHRTVNTGLQVPVMVISQKEIFVVELPDGNVVQLSQDAVN